MSSDDVAIVMTALNMLLCIARDKMDDGAAPTYEDRQFAISMGDRATQILDSALEEDESPKTDLQ